MLSPELSRVSPRTCPSLIIAALSGLLSLLVLVAGVVFLLNGRYLASTFKLALGIDRWIPRVAADAALMTDAYPPFRLELGGDEPKAEAAPPDVIAL